MRMSKMPYSVHGIRGMFSVLVALSALAADATAQSASSSPMVLVPDAVWDGSQDAPQKGAVVLIKGSRIEAVGRAGQIDVPAGGGGGGAAGAEVVSWAVRGP